MKTPALAARALASLSALLVSTISPAFASTRDAVRVPTIAWATCADLPGAECVCGTFCTPGGACLQSLPAPVGNLCETSLLSASYSQLRARALSACAACAGLPEATPRVARRPPGSSRATLWSPGCSYGTFT